METIIETLNKSRESVINTHYSAAIMEIKEKVEAEPLRETFEIYSGCPSDLIAEAVSKRLNADGLQTTVSPSTMVKQCYLKVKIDLPENFKTEQKE